VAEASSRRDASTLRSNEGDDLLVCAGERRGTHDQLDTRKDRTGMVPVCDHELSRGVDDSVLRGSRRMEVDEPTTGRFDRLRHRDATVLDDETLEPDARVEGRSGVAGKLSRR